MKRVLVIYYTQTGQLRNILDQVLAPLAASSDVQITWLALRPRPPFPFPWPVPKFLNAFPESFQMRAIPCDWDPIPDPDRFDLVVLAYQVWYLAPSLPMSAFLQSSDADVLRGKPVITVVNARDKWLTAQEKVKNCLRERGARLIDNVAFIHAGTPFQHTVTTLRWLWTGHKEAFGSFPAAGVSDADLAAAPRFGEAIRDALQKDAPLGEASILHGLGAVQVDADTVMQEEVARRVFHFWSSLILHATRLGSLVRILALFLFSVFLLVLLIIAGPVVLLDRLFTGSSRREAMVRKIAEYELPSGSSTERIQTKK